MLFVVVKSRCKYSNYRYCGKKLEDKFGPKVSFNIQKLICQPGFLQNQTACRAENGSQPLACKPFFRAHVEIQFNLIRRVSILHF